MKEEKKYIIRYKFANLYHWNYFTKFSINHNGNKDTCSEGFIEGSAIKKMAYKEALVDIKEITRIRRIRETDFQEPEIVDFDTQKVVNIEEINTPIKKFTRFQIMDI